jgi:hypothetical protein
MSKVHADFSSYNFFPNLLLDFPINLRATIFTLTYFLPQAKQAQALAWVK